MVHNKRFGLMLMLIALTVILASCATVGRQFPTGDVQRIEIGKTTKQAVTDIFGPPWRIGLEDGVRTWTYGYYKYRLFGDTTTYDLVVRFNNNGIVTSYSFNTTEIAEDIQ
jgi:hypothetical protein